MQNYKAVILVVEDDGMLRDLIVKKFQSTFTVISAEDGEKALKEVNEHKPDLILLDLMLPKIDGFEVLETLRNHTDKKIAETSVVILSNLWSNKDILRIQSLKIDEYYVKSNTELDVVYKRVQQIIVSKPDK